jgi:hypothetical protein
MKGTRDICFCSIWMICIVVKQLELDQANKQTAYPCQIVIVVPESLNSSSVHDVHRTFLHTRHTICQIHLGRLHDS